MMRAHRLAGSQPSAENAGASKHKLAQANSGDSVLSRPTSKQFPAASA